MIVKKKQLKKKINKIIKQKLKIISWNKIFILKKKKYKKQNL